MSYVLVTMAIGAIAFLVVALVSRAVRDRPGILSWWGENPLALYLLHLLLLSIVVLIAAISTVAWWLHRWHVRMRL